MEITNTRSLLGLLAVILISTPGVFSRGRSSFDVLHPPKFLPSSNNYTFRAGQVAVLDCIVTNLGKKKVVWRRASDAVPLTVGYLPFNQDPRYGVEHAKNTNSWNLVIREVRKSDSGVYECQVSSLMRHLRHHVTLLVLDPLPPTVLPSNKPKIQISGSNYVDEGDRIFLQCKATSRDYPPEDIDWFRSGNALNTKPLEGMFIRKHVSLVKGTIVSTMEIKHARLTDQGTYVCRTSNKDVTSIIINVLKGDTNNVKRNTEKKIAGQTTFMEHKGNGNGGKALTSNVVFLLVLSLMTSLVTSHYCSVREVT